MFPLPSFDRKSHCMSDGTPSFEPFLIPKSRWQLPQLSSYHLSSRLQEPDMEQPETGQYCILSLPWSSMKRNSS